jgi:uncharacterized Fe-S cluster protein YjdI
MDQKEIIKEYTNGELTIVWKPKTCIHAETCVKTLPNVYSATQKPWLKIENATTQEFKDQINQCPSGALSYYMNDGSDKKEESTGIDVVVKAKGPLLVHGTLNVTDVEGKKVLKENITAFCRCGASINKPYCDGSHAKINFSD